MSNRRHIPGANWGKFGGNNCLSSSNCQMSWFALSPVVWLSFALHLLLSIWLSPEPCHLQRWLVSKSLTGFKTQNVCLLALPVVCHHGDGQTWTFPCFEPHLMQKKHVHVFPLKEALGDTRRPPEVIANRIARTPINTPWMRSELFLASYIRASSWTCMYTWS